MDGIYAEGLAEKITHSECGHPTFSLLARPDIFFLQELPGDVHQRCIDFRQTPRIDVNMIEEIIVLQKISVINQRHVIGCADSAIIA